MPEATLAITYTEMLAIAGRKAGFGADPTAWGTANRALIDEKITEALRRFYAGAVLPGEKILHTWSFLRPVTTLTTAANDNLYDVPADCGQVLAPVTHAANLGHPAVQFVGESMIRDLLSRSTDPGRPRYMTMRPKIQVADSKQAFEFVLYPIPDAIYVLTYKYSVLPLKLSDSNEYPYGADQHASTIRASVLATVEQEILEITNGPELARFNQLMMESILRDRRVNMPDTISRTQRNRQPYRRSSGQILVEGPDGNLAEWGS